MIRYACAAILSGVLAQGIVRADESAKTDQSTEIEVLVQQLTSDDPTERLSAVQNAGSRLSEYPDLLLPAMIKCARAADPPLRPKCSRLSVGN